MLLSVTFTAKLEFVFVLTFENGFSQSFHFKLNKKSIGSSKKKVPGIIKIALRLRDWPVLGNQLKETRNSVFCVTPKNQALHESSSVFLK